MDLTVSLLLGHLGKLTSFFSARLTRFILLFGLRESTYDVRTYHNGPDGTYAGNGLGAIITNPGGNTVLQAGPGSLPGKGW